MLYSRHNTQIFKANFAKKDKFMLYLKIVENYEHKRSSHHAELISSVEKQLIKGFRYYHALNKKE